MYLRGGEWQEGLDARQAMAKTVLDGVAALILALGKEGSSTSTSAYVLTKRRQHMPWHLNMD